MIGIKKRYERAALKVLPFGEDLGGVFPREGREGFSRFFGLAGTKGVQEITNPFFSASLSAYPPPPLTNSKRAVLGTKQYRQNMDVVTGFS